MQECPAWSLSAAPCLPPCSHQKAPAGYGCCVTLTANEACMIIHMLSVAHFLMTWPHFVCMLCACTQGCSVMRMLLHSCSLSIMIKSGRVIVLPSETGSSKTELSWEHGLVLHKLCICKFLKRSKPNPVLLDVGTSSFIRFDRKCTSRQD